MKICRQKIAKREISNKNTLNKKGFMYLISAVILAAILFSVILASDSNVFKDRQRIDEKRVIYMNDFVKGFNQDFERAMQIASFRTMIALEDHVASTGNFLNNTAESFKETVYLGTINNETSAIMNNSCLQNYIERVTQISSRLGLNVTINITNIELSQSNPWYLDVNAETEVHIFDSTNLAYWTYNKTYYAKVPIDNLRDPLYSVFTYNRLSNTVRQSNYTSLVTGQNTTNLTNHSDAGYYLASNLSPNFIMRFENNLSPNENGIESIVSIDALNAQDLDNIYLDRIKIDFIYFNNLTRDQNNNTYQLICEIDNMPEEFVITQDRIELYEIDLLNYSTSCS